MIERMMGNFKSKTFIFLSLLLIASLIANVFLFVRTEKLSQKETDFKTLEKQYPLLSKRILSEYPQDLLINFLPLRTALQSGIEPYGDSFGIYFEYLPTGTSIGINEKNEFSAASLFKLPVVMAYYRMKERTGKNNDPVVTIAEQDIDNRFGDLWQKGPGTSISLEQAVDLALEESDNTAAKTLVPHITQGDFNDVYEGLDIALQINGEGAVMTAKHYSSILKALYFSSVLNKDNSQNILDKLTKTKFTDKIPAGIPADIRVAHKIGVFHNDKDEAYMDCGIVYVPRRPYMLCMISKTNDKTAQERMQRVSATVYSYVAEHK